MRLFARCGFLLSLLFAAAASASPAAGTLGLSASAYSVAESGGSAVITVDRTGGSTGAVSVFYTTVSGTATSSDYSPQNGRVYWNSGDTSPKTFSVPILDTDNFSGTKQFSVAIKDVYGGAALGVQTATVSIQSGAGTLELSSSSYSVSQSLGSLKVTVNRTGGSTGAVSVFYATATGSAQTSDFSMKNGRLAWATGDLSPKTFIIPISEAVPFAGTKQFTVTIKDVYGAAKLGTPTTATATIIGSAALTPIPAVPTGFTANAGNALAALSWSASGGATSYHVKRATTSGGPYSQVGAPTGTSYTDSPLTNGTTYYYVVSALDSAGESANSAQVTAKPTAPASNTGLPSGPGFNFTSAPALGGVTVVQNRDSVIIQVPAVANARDFRVLVQPTSVAANSNGTESVQGGTQFCAGVRQHQARTHFVADPVSLFPYYFYINGAIDSPTDEAPPNFYGPPPTPWSWFDLDTPPNSAIEVTGVTANMTVTVEALDRLCPFPGAIGQQHQDITLTHSGGTDNPGNPWLDATSIVTFPVVTEAEVVAKYGSLIINGQGWAGGPNVQANPPAKPPFAQPAAVNPPIVLARAAVAISPLTNPPAPPAGFFDDFSNSNDTFQTLPQPKWTYPRYPSGGELIMQNSKWTVYGNGFTCCTPTAGSDGQGYADAYVENGTLHTTLGDWSQDVLSEITMIPRKAAHLNATNYLHVTYEVPSFATSRRYWVVTLCGSSVAGQTLDSTGTLKEQIVHSTFFYLNTGMSPSTAGWNCLQIFNRQGNSNAFSNWESMYNIKGGRPPVPPNKGLYDLADYIYNSIPSISDPSKTAAYTVHPESDVMVMINKPIPAANLPEIGGTNEQVVQSTATSPVNVSPLQLDNPNGEVAWFYKVDANGNPTAPILDDQQLVSPRTKYDLYIRNNRIIMYVNGTSTLCNDFTTPTTTLNIADAAVGFHQVLYHSSAEFQERFDDPDRGGAYYYRYNSPWLDQRTWDNIGFEENVSPPSDFNPATCFVHTSLGAENNEP